MNVRAESAGASGGSLSGKMKQGVHPAAGNGDFASGRERGFTLHMAQLSSLPCKVRIGWLRLMVGKGVQLHLAR